MRRCPGNPVPPHGRPRRLTDRHDSPMAGQASMERQTYYDRCGGAGRRPSRRTTVALRPRIRRSGRGCLPICLPSVMCPPDRLRTPGDRHPTQLKREPQVVCQWHGRGQARGPRGAQDAGSGGHVEAAEGARQRSAEQRVRAWSAALPPLPPAPKLILPRHSCIRPVILS